MNAMSGKEFAIEAKRQELIKELHSSGYIGLSDGRTLDQLTLSELQDAFRKVER